MTEITDHCLLTVTPRSWAWRQGSADGAYPGSYAADGPSPRPFRPERLARYRGAADGVTDEGKLDTRGGEWRG
jgi:hypothetical protein